MKPAALLVLLLAAPPALAQAPMSPDSSIGAALKGYRATFGLTQSGLAALTCFPAPCTPTVSATRISRIERGLDTGTTAQQDSLARALYRVFRARYHPTTEAKLAALLLRNRP